MRKHNRHRNVLFFFFFLIVGCYSTCHQKDHQIAIKNLHKHLKDLKIKSNGESCSKYDSDGDNYVSCEYKNEQDEIVYLECWGDQWINNDGCRSPQPKIHIHEHNTVINHSK